jgi:hypothetical protein
VLVVCVCVCVRARVCVACCTEARRCGCGRHVCDRTIPNYTYHGGLGLAVCPKIAGAIGYDTKLPSVSSKLGTTLVVNCAGMCTDPHNRFRVL